MKALKLGEQKEGFDSPRIVQDATLGKIVYLPAHLIPPREIPPEELALMQKAMREGPGAK